MPQLDAHGRRLDFDHYQLKFQVDFRRDVGGLELIDPRFTTPPPISAPAGSGGDRERRYPGSPDLGDMVAHGEHRPIRRLAGIVLVRDDPRDVPGAMELSRASCRK